MPRRKVKEKHICNSQNILRILRNNSDRIQNVFPDINYMFAGGRTLLTLAIENGEDVRLVEAIVTSGADVNQHNAKGQNALMIAARCKRNDVLQLLVNFGGKLDLMNNKKTTALSICVTEDFIEGINTLVNSGADVNLKTGPLKETAIELATRLQLKQVQDVLRRGNLAAVNDDKNVENSTCNEKTEPTEPTHIVPSIVARTNVNFNREVIGSFQQITRHNTTGQKSNCKTLYKLALRLHKNGSLNKRYDSGRTLLMQSAMIGSENSLKYICSLGADVNLKDNDGRTALMYVFISKLSLSAQTLCKLIGENPCSQDKYGKSALMYAFENKFHLPLYFVKLLIGQCFLVPHPYMESFIYCDISSEIFQGDSQNIADIKGRTHLMYAIMNVPNIDPDMVNVLVGNQALLNYGANPESRDYEGRTALMIAMTLKFDLSESLLKDLVGGNINIQDNNGKTVLMYALEYFVSEERIATILSLSPNVDVQDNDGRTVLMYAVKVSALLSRSLFMVLASGDVNKQDLLGRTALMYAMQYEVSNDILKTLILCGSDVNICDKLGENVLVQLIAEKRSPCSGNCNSTSLFSYLDLANFIRNIRNMDFRNQPKNRCRIDILQLVIERSHLVLSKENRCIVSNFFQMHSRYSFKWICCDSKKLLQQLMCHGIFLKPETVKGSRFWETSYLLVALELGYLDIAKYLMANYCMTNKDLNFLKKFYTSPLFSRSGFIGSFSRMPEMKVSKETIQFVEQVTSQPWPLVSLALLAISSTISFDENREERVTKLPIPQLMKNYLMFRSPVATTPVSEWSEITLFGESINSCSRIKTCF